ncbi:hypothetical protein G4B88_006997 [Cannabis sativa]|uniref:Uncharacterized protein n=1 Tax=Cannabis sativa TaxID=3483 RepID=A0A7J6FNF5_CANSA|nr:hypothetical protein G4B88_006997 [Cannabis sativa]
MFLSILDLFNYRFCSFVAIPSRKSTCIDPTLNRVFTAVIKARVARIELGMLTSDHWTIIVEDYIENVNIIFEFGRRLLRFLMSFSVLGYSQASSKPSKLKSLAKAKVDSTNLLCFSALFAIIEIAEEGSSFGRDNQLSGIILNLKKGIIQGGIR